MKRLIGWALIYIGVATLAYGGWHALSHLIGMYQGVLADPLADPLPDSPQHEQAVSKSMLQGAAIGSAGLLTFIVGSIVLKFGKRR